MNNIHQSTIYFLNHVHLFTHQVMREYLNLFVTLFREYSINNGENVLIEKL